MFKHSFARPPLFLIGEVASTYPAIDAMVAEGISINDLLPRHQSGDWGDLCKHDLLENDRSLRDGGRIMSSYKLPNTGVTIWVITEADRSVTTFLLPSDY
jgi:hypothetical protein